MDKLKKTLNKKLNIPFMNISIIFLSAVIFGSGIYVLYRRSTFDRSLIGKSIDKTIDSAYENINILRGRPDNWRRIASERMLEHEDFAQIDGSTATIPITSELARQFCDADDDSIRQYVCHNTTHNAYTNLMTRGTNDIIINDGEKVSDIVRLIFVTQPSDEELAMAQENGVTLEIEPVAMDGFVFITHKDNPVDSLTVQQVRDIYSGKITNWSEVGGRDEKIRTFQRDKNSGSQTAMEELVMQGTPLTEAPRYYASGMEALVDGVAEYENDSFAIGYTYYYYLNNLYNNSDIKVLNIDGISPENENLLSGEYPFTTSYYAVMRSDEPEDSKMRRLRDYMLTDEGQQIVELAGYCPVGGAK